jgi:TRAP-type C4-dicarboxylate transport system substrate-binding protein
MLLISKRSWDALSPDEQKIFRQAAKESVPYMRKLWDAKEAASRAIVENAGSQIVEVDKAPFQRAMKPVYDKFITDAKLKDMIKRVQDTK